jgi:hypothetical protein
MPTYGIVIVFVMVRNLPKTNIASESFRERQLAFRSLSMGIYFNIPIMCTNQIGAKVSAIF